MYQMIGILFCLDIYANNVENMKTIKESHVLSLLRYFDLVRELQGMH